MCAEAGRNSTIHSPAIRFPNNQIPSNLITPQAKTLLSIPARADQSRLRRGCRTARRITSRRVTNDIGINGVDYRMDGQLSAKDSVYGVFHWSKGSPWYLAPPVYPDELRKQPDYGYTDFAISATETHIFSPTAINEFRAAWVVHASVRTGQNTDFKPWSCSRSCPSATTAACRPCP